MADLQDALLVFFPLLVWISMSHCGTYIWFHTPDPELPRFIHTLSDGIVDGFGFNRISSLGAGTLYTYHILLARNGDRGRVAIEFEVTLT